MNHCTLTLRTLALALLLIGVTRAAQAQELNWARQFSSAERIAGRTLSLDGNGNMYVTGSFQAAADLDPGPGTTQLTPSGNWDVFVTKLDASGELVWAKQIGGNIQAYCRASAVDASGNLYMVGDFQGTVDFDLGPGSFALTSAGGNDIFVCKWNADGELVWARSMGGSSSDVGRSIAVDGNGNVYTAGTFQGTVDFDPGAGTFELSSAGGSDTFICKLDASGDLLWAKQLSGTSDMACRSIALDGSGATYITGHFFGTADFDPGPGVFSLTSAGARDVFVCKLDAAGDLVWAKRLGGGSDAFSTALILDGNGHVLTTGYFAGTMDLDPGADTHEVTSAGSYDVFVSKLDQDGDFLWGKHFGGPAEDLVNGIAVDVNGGVYLTGYFGATADMDPSTMDSFTLTSAGEEDIYFNKLDASGNFAWAIGMGSPGWDIGSAIAVDASGTIYATGHFYLSTDFDPSDTETFTLTSAGMEDAFVLKLGQCLSTASTETTTACNSYNWNNSTYTASGTYELQFTNAAGCDSTATLVLTITTVDDAVALVGATLTAAQAGAAYQWLDCNNSFALIAGANDQSFTPTENGNYAVEVTLDGCPVQSECVEVLTTSVAEMEQGALRVYPVPASDHVVIEGTVGNELLELLDAQGRLVRRKGATADRSVLDLAGLDAGSYLVRTIGPHGTHIARFVKQ